MPYSEGGPWNGQISNRPMDTGLNPSGSIPIWSGDLQLQGLTLCGAVTAGRILEILTHFWPVSEPCGQTTINDMDFMFPVPSLPSLA